MLAEKLPDWLLKYTEKISALGAFAGKTANHVLVNEYKPGEGIMVRRVHFFLFSCSYPYFISTFSPSASRGWTTVSPHSNNDQSGFSYGSRFLQACLSDSGSSRQTHKQSYYQPQSLNVLVLSPQSEVPQTEESRYMLSLLVQQKSLLILQDDMYKCYLHGIQGVSEDILSEHVVNLSSTGALVGDALPRSTRVSLTIRHVPKVVRANLLLGKK